MDESPELPIAGYVKAKKRIFIETKLLPIKLHYFLSYAALGGVLPFVPLLIKSTGINATAFGIIFTVTRFTAVITKPIIGAITDYLKNIRCVIIIVALGVVVSYSSLLLIPPIHSNGNWVTVECGGDQNTLDLPTTHNLSCADFRQSETIKCETQIDLCATNDTRMGANRNNSGLICDSEEKKMYLNFLMNAKNSTISKLENNNPVLPFKIINLNAEISSTAICMALLNHSASIQCSPNEDACIVPPHGSKSDFVYSTYQFWIVFLLEMIGGVSSTAIFSLSDTACYELLKDRPQSYGIQRLWGSASWGIIALLAGYLNDLHSSGTFRPNYSPGIFIMLVMMALDIALLLSQTRLRLSTTATNVFKDVCLVFTSLKVVAFAISSFAVGSLTALHWTYEFWFLQTLGASQLLLGLTLVVQTLISEAPMFFFSGWILQRLGHFLCLTLTFLAFSVRYVFYYMLKNPWYVLPIDMLHGVTFGLFYSTMTSFANENAPAGTEATLQGVFSALFRGLGIGVGGLLGGVGFDRIGGHKTFLWGAIGSFICAFILSFFSFLLKWRNSLHLTAGKVEELKTTKSRNVLKTASRNSLQ